MLADFICENLVKINVSVCTCVLSTHSHIELVVNVLGEPAVFPKIWKASVYFKNHLIIFKEVNSPGCFLKKIILEILLHRWWQVSSHQQLYSKPRSVL